MKRNFATWILNHPKKWDSMLVGRVSGNERGDDLLDDVRLLLDKGFFDAAITLIALASDDPPIDDTINSIGLRAWIKRAKKHGQKKTLKAFCNEWEMRINVRKKERRMLNAIDKRG